MSTKQQSQAHTQPLKRKRRAPDEGRLQHAEHEDPSASGQSLEMLRNPQASRAARSAAALDLQHTVGNAQVARELARRQRLSTATADVGRGERDDTREQPAEAVQDTGGSRHPVQRFWKKLKNAVSSAWGGVKKAASSAWGGVKKAANATWSGIKWVGRQLWSKLEGIYHRAINWITQLPARLKRLFLHLWEGVKSLKPWSLQWWKSLGQLSTWGAFLEWTGTALIQILEVAGVGEVYETLADFIKFNTRPLTGAEIGKAKMVFGGSINYSLVRVDQGAFIGPSWTDRAYVSFHTINAWGPLDDHTLIHELTHVWQYGQMGAIYMPKALHAQKSGGYNYGGLAELKKRKLAGQGFHSFNLEQQGDITADYYVGAVNGGFAPEAKATYEHFVKTVRD